MKAKDVRNVFVGFVVGAIGLSALAAVTIPHTFVAGTPIKAGEVNANFSAVKTAIDALSSATLPFGSTITGSGDAALTLNNTTTAAGKYALSATTTSPIPEGAAVRGRATNGTGVIGDSDAGNGVIGRTGTGAGVAGQSYTGNGVFGEGLTTGSGVTGYAVTGVGVAGRSTDVAGIGVRAMNEVAGGTALEVRGGIKVVGSAKPAFVLTASANNLNPNNVYLYIDSPLSDGDDTAILIVTRITPGNLSATYAVPVVGYDGGRWYIQNNDQSTIAVGARFSVLIIKQ